jgi:myosin heavy subunit
LLLTRDDPFIANFLNQMAATQRAEQRIAMLVEENLRLASRVSQLEASNLAASSHRSERSIHEHATMIESSTAGVQLAVENVKLVELHSAASARAEAAQEHVQRLVTLGKRKDASLAALQARFEEQAREHDETKNLVSELYADRERLTIALEAAQNEARAAQGRESHLSQSLHQALQAAATATSRGTEAAGEAIALRRQAAEASDQLEDAEKRLEDVAAQLAALRETHDNTVSRHSKRQACLDRHKGRRDGSRQASTGCASPRMQVRMYQTQIYDLTRRVHVQESASTAFASSMAAAGSRGTQQQQQQQQQSALSRSTASADATSRELMTALGVSMGPPASPAAQLRADRNRGMQRTTGREVDLSPFGDSVESIELAGAKAAVQRLQKELAAAQQVRIRPSTFGARELKVLKRVATHSAACAPA